MGNLEQNRRRNQIIAARTAEKVEAKREWSGWSDRKLWDAVEDCIVAARRTHTYMGHIDRSAEAVIAHGALAELKMRGTQTRLPV